MTDWHPIEDAPIDGTSVLLAFGSGRIDIGRYEHTTWTTNGRVVSEHAGWVCQSFAANAMFTAGAKSEPTHFALITNPPEPAS